MSRVNVVPGRVWVCLVAVVCCLISPAGEAVFPEDSGVVNVKRAPYNAKGDGVADDTRAIQAALDANANSSRIIFLPAGTYLVSDTLKWGKGRHGGMSYKRTIMQGQGAGKTVIRLQDNCPGFQKLTVTKRRKGRNAESSKAVIWTGKAPAQRFRNGIRDLTVDIGKGNAKATGIQYIANNQGSLRNVRVVSAEGGYIGLDLGFSDEQGPCLIKNVTVEGFATGIRTKYVVDSVTLEDIRVKGQSKLGFDNGGQCVSLRGFKSDNNCPAIRNESINSLLTLIEAELTGMAGAGEMAAIENTGYLLARDCRTSGYKLAIDSKVGKDKKYHRTAADGAVSEFLSHDAYTLFPAPAKTLRLPLKETPKVPLHPLADWVSPVAFGARLQDKQDDTEAVQKAVDAGKRVVYLPPGLRIDGTVVIRGSVEVVTACEGSVSGKGTFKIADGTPATVFVERMNLLYQGINLEHATSRTLVISGITFGHGEFRYPGTGDLFLEDVCMGSLQIKGQNVWARQLNIETKGGHKILNDGGKLWLLGYKTEQHGICCETRNGGQTEILGGFIYAQGKPKATPMLICNNSDMSVTVGEVCWNFGRQGYGTLVRETRGTETKELKGGAKAGRYWHANGASMVLLYSARRKLP